MRGARFIGAACGLGLAIACAVAPIQPPPPPSFRLAVLDFRVPDTWRNPEIPDQSSKEMQGWWFGSRKLWHNPGWGRVAGDVFSLELNRLPFISIVSRVDIKYYMADKSERVRTVLEERRRELERSSDPRDLEEAKRIQEMSPADYDRMLERLPPREIGRELNVDRVLVGRIHDAYLAHNRTIHWYWSYVDLEVQLVDVDTGRVVWYRRAPFKKNFTSISFLLETAAREVVEMMKREYLYQR